MQLQIRQPLRDKLRGIEHEAPARAPPRYQEESLEFGSREDLYESMITIDD